METSKSTPMSYKLLLLTAAIIFILAAYSLRNTDRPSSNDEESNVSLCQIRVQFDGSHEFDDRRLLALLSTLKMHDFLIGQPVWGPADTLFYLCEHRLKIGLRQTLLDKQLHDVMKNSPGSSSSSVRLAWSCA